MTDKQCIIVLFNSSADHLEAKHIGPFPSLNEAWKYGDLNLRRRCNWIAIQLEAPE